MEMNLTPNPEVNPKEIAVDDLAAYASEYEAWLDELEQVVREYGNPNVWQEA